MKVSLLTDAPKHNLALMKLSAWHKERNDQVCLNQPLWPADKRYASILFEWNRNKFLADEYGGPGYNFESLSIECRPDYDLYDLDFSLGYTYRHCSRNCQFCKVTQIEKDKSHHSIWDFHSPEFKKICLLNNNTFFDPDWYVTFDEIWADDLIIKDENGYDLRLIDEAKAFALMKTRWDHGPKFAWDRMRDEKEILRGFDEINRIGFKYCTVYVLIGFDTTLEEDIYRCQKIHDLGHNPFPMIYKETTALRKFRRMIYTRYYRKDGNIERAWRNYKNV